MRDGQCLIVIGYHSNNVSRPRLSEYEYNHDLRFDQGVQLASRRDDLYALPV